MELFDKAVVFACQKHSGQRRKLSDVPYFLHPMEVASIVGTMSDSQELLAAAVLHDTVEDTDTTIEEIKDNFGKRVYLLVMTETEDKRDDKPAAETWELRKEETLNILQNTKDLDVKKLWLGDKLSNLRSFYRGHKAEGEKFWNHFNQNDPKKQEWYYRTVAAALTELKEYDAYEEFVSLIDLTFGNREDIK